MLSSLIFIPLAAALVIALFVPRDKVNVIKAISVTATVIPLVVVGLIWSKWDYATQAMQFVEQHSWIPSVGVEYFLGTDGISFSMLILTAIMSVLACIASFGIKHREKEFFALYLVLVTGMYGVFTALDFILFYIFWELVLVPMYFLIGIWGGPRREYAALKFFIYTLVGSVVMLVGILALYFQSGLGTFNMLDLTKAAYPLRFAWWAFLALYLGFAVKVPVFPFHTWLPDAHVEAPTPISVILAAVLLKMGTYGFLRVSMPILPEAMKTWAPFFATVGLINIVYGAFVALSQKDLKKLVAYSSISHMGFVMLGFAAATPQAITGAVYQMFSHGLISGMLFLLVGVVYDRTHTREIARLRGFYITMPVWATIMAFASFASLGLPGLSGFVAEFLVLVGSLNVYRTITIIAALGIVVVASFYLLMMRRILMGEPMEEWKKLPDASPREMVTLIPLILLIALFGILPSTLINIINPSVLSVVAKLGGS